MKMIMIYNKEHMDILEGSFCCQYWL